MKIRDNKTGKVYGPGKMNDVLYEIVAEIKELRLVYCDLETMAVGMDGNIYILDETNHYDEMMNDRFTIDLEIDEVIPVMNSIIRSLMTNDKYKAWFEEFKGFISKLKENDECKELFDEFETTKNDEM